MAIHPTARTWVLPPSDRAPLPAPLQRTNLRVLASRVGRLEHHLTVVARAGDAQLEVVAASEPLFFAHANISDEYVIALKTGDALVDGIPFRVFLTDPQSNEDVGRINHRTHDMVLHPHGLLHWPGRLRPPFAVPRFPGGMRRTALSLVFCGAVPREASPKRALGVNEGREDAVKAYGDASPPFLLTEIRNDLRDLAFVGNTTLSLEAPPFAPERGGYVVVLEGDSPAAFAGDLVYVPPGASWDPPIRAALVLSAETEAHEPPAVWARVPELPFGEPLEGAPAAASGELAVNDLGDEAVELRVGATTTRVPRYWLARMLYRIALHTSVVDGVLTEPTPCFGYVETYGGFFYDDRSGTFRFGIRGGDEVTIAPELLLPTLSGLYSASRPPEHVEI